MPLFHPVRTLLFHPIQTLTAGAIGAAAVYLMDPQHGEERRAQLNEQIKAQVAKLREGGAFSDVPSAEPVLIPPATATVTDLSDSGPTISERTDAEVRPT